MKKYLACILLLLGVLLTAGSRPAQAGTVYGESAVGYDSNAREIFGYSATWTDYDTSFYYDPAVEGELYWQFDNEVPLDSGFDTGFSNPDFGYQIPAEVWLFSSQYRPITTYSTYSNHFLAPYYTDYYGYSFYDPFGFSFFGGGFFGGYYDLPGYGFYPDNYVWDSDLYVFSTGVSITTPSDSCRLPGASFDENGQPCSGNVTPVPTPSSSLSVQLEGISAVPKNGQVTLHVYVAPMDNQTPINLNLSKDANTTGSATFDDGTLNRVITQTTTVVIKGVTESSTKDNISLTATAQGTALYKIKFSVLWVVLSFRTGLDQEVSNDNAAKAYYISRVGVSHLGTFRDLSSIPLWGTAVEIVGTVYPHDFSQPVMLNRKIIGMRTFKDRSLRDQAYDKPDPSNPQLRDDDPQSDMSDGKIYDLDSPGIGFYPPSGNIPPTPVGTIARIRQNFNEWAEFNGMKVSADFPWFSRVSIKKTADADVLVNDDLVMYGTDNVARTGSTPLTWNLGPEPTAPPPGTSPIDNSQTFVEWHYLDFLNREPDQSGWDFWTGQITQCGSDSTCIDNKRVDVGRAFFYSDEFMDQHPELRGTRGTHDYNAAFVLACYQAYLRREPNDPPDNNWDGFNFWVNKLDSSNPDGGDWKYNEMIRAFLLSDEYRTRFPQ